MEEFRSPITSNRNSWKLFPLAEIVGVILKKSSPITSNRNSWKLCFFVVRDQDLWAFVHRLLQIGIVGNLASHSDSSVRRSISTKFTDYFKSE